MATSYIIVDYMLNEMVAELMRSHRMDYQEALETVVASKTYKRLLTDEDLQEEGSLFIIELLEKELTEQREETPAEA